VRDGDAPAGHRARDGRAGRRGIGVALHARRPPCRRRRPRARRRRGRRPCPAPARVRRGRPTDRHRIRRAPLLRRLQRWTQGGLPRPGRHRDDPGGAPSPPHRRRACDLRHPGRQPCARLRAGRHRAGPAAAVGGRDDRPRPTTDRCVRRAARRRPRRGLCARRVGRTVPRRGTLRRRGLDERRASAGSQPVPGGQGHGRGGAHRAHGGCRGHGGRLRRRDAGGRRLRPFGRRGIDAGRAPRHREGTGAGPLAGTGVGARADALRGPSAQRPLRRNSFQPPSWMRRWRPRWRGSGLPHASRSSRRARSPCPPRRPELP
jgi:hypothetical protein